jgi:hypothetical protein
MFLNDDNTFHAAYMILIYEGVKMGISRKQSQFYEY